jgi:uroporphyrinogen-III decarboxylase
MPLLDEFVEVGIDVVIGVDPAAWDLQATKEILGNKVCIWGGVNGHLTVEQGSQAKIREEVRIAMQQLSPGAGFVLSPVDNVREYSSSIKENVATMIDEWQQLAASESKD